MRKAWRKVKLGGETGVAMPEQERPNHPAAASAERDGLAPQVR